MTNKGKKILVIVTALFVLASILMLIVPKHNYSSQIRNVVEIRDGVADPAEFKTSLTVKEGGKYTFSVNWWKEDEEPGFVTALKVTDEAGNAVYTITGGNLFADSTPMDLKAGKYLFSFEILATPEAYIEYAGNNFADSEIGEADSDYFRDGIWEMDYKVEISQYLKGAYALGLAAGVVLGILVIALVVVASRKEDAPVRKYDERQIAAQGKAYKRGYITMVIFCTVLIILKGVKIDIPAEPNLLILIGLFAGGIATITGLIMDDAYFRMDENRKMWIIFFSLLSVLNLGVGVSRIASGEAVVNGVASFDGFTNLLCGVFMVYMLVVILIKGIKDRKED